MAFVGIPVKLGKINYVSVTFTDENDHPVDPQTVLGFIRDEDLNQQDTFIPLHESIGVYWYPWIPTEVGNYYIEFEGTFPDTHVDILRVGYEVSVTGIGEPQANLLARPTLTGRMRISPLYQNMGQGLTDRIFLIGHGDGIDFNTPFQVTSVQDAVNFLGADIDCPLLRGLLEAYYSGARDIWLIAAAPMGEYEPDVSLRREQRAEWGNKNFYELYKERLAVAYHVLRKWDLPQIVVPLEAPFYETGGTDFATDLKTHCEESLVGYVDDEEKFQQGTGAVRIGVLGTRIPGGNTHDHMVTMAADSRPDTQEEGGKFVVVVVGEGVINMKEMPTLYTASLAASAAGLLSTMPLNTGWIYKALPNVMNLVGPNLKSTEIDMLVNNKLNPVLRTYRGRRQQPFQTVVATDNTLGADGTDFWSLLQTRLVMQIIEAVRSMSQRQIGEIGFAEYKRKVNDYMFGLTTANVIKNYNLNISRNPSEMSRAFVDIMITPYFGLRELRFGVEVGPSL